MELDKLVAPRGDLPDVDVATAGHLDEIVAFDTVAFGACRANLLGVLWREYRDRVLFARDASGALAGYVFARDPTLGPWAAQHRSAAEALLYEALRLPFAFPPQVLVPRSSETCAGLLAEYGFLEVRRLRHMRRGGDRSPGTASMLYGQSSFTHG